MRARRRLVPAPSQFRNHNVSDSTQQPCNHCPRPFFSSRFRIDNLARVSLETCARTIYRLATYALPGVAAMSDAVDLAYFADRDCTGGTARSVMRTRHCTRGAPTVSSDEICENCRFLGPILFQSTVRLELPQVVATTLLNLPQDGRA